MSKKKDTSTETMLVLAAASLVFYLFYTKDWFLYSGLGIAPEKAADFAPRHIFIYVALGLALSGLFIKPLARLIDWLWMKLAALIGLVMPKLILSLIFYLLLFPIALLSRLSSKDPLSLRGKAKKSLFTDLGRSYRASDMEKMW
jgi:hypothetical protein